jgi:hypothetical protein
MISLLLEYAAAVVVAGCVYKKFDQDHWPSGSKWWVAAFWPTRLLTAAFTFFTAGVLISYLLLVAYAAVEQTW